MKNSTIQAAVAAFTVAATTLAGDIYVNDFATRTSKEPIPAIGGWQTATPYPAQKGYLRYWVKGAEAPYTTAAPLSAYYLGDANSGYGRPNVDGWYSPNIGPYTLAPYYWKEFSGSIAENPVFSWAYNSTSATSGQALHPIHNEFTNGLLRMQVDLKAPVEWYRANDRIAVFPVYRKYLEILAWPGSGHESVADLTPGKVGIRDINSGTPLSTTYAYWSNNNGWHQTNNSGGQIGDNCSGNFAGDGSDGKTNYWFRYIVTYDLDNNTFGGELYRFSKALGHPSFDTDPSDATPYQSFANKPARTALSAETGGIAGFGIGLTAAVQTDAAKNEKYKPFVDNIRLSWKAPGTSDFEVFYENDFTTRRYRTLCPPSARAYAQSTATVSETEVFNYPASASDLPNNRIIPGKILPVENPQPIGLDGWRKLPYRNHSSAGGHPAIVAYGGTTYDAGGVGTNMLTFGDQANFATLGQTLGASYTSGKVKLSVDARLPAGASFNSTARNFRRMAVGLGSAALYGPATTSAAACAEIAAGVGYDRLSQVGPDSSSRPYTLAAYTSGDEPTRNYPASYTAPETNAWYRMIVEADIDARTYDVSMTPLGTASVLPDFVPVESPIFEATDLPFAANVANIATFYLYGYGYGSNVSDANINNRVCFDNIRAWHDSDLIYDNDFKTRTRSIAGVTRETGELTAQQYNLDGGQDNWVRRDYTGPAGFEARAWVRDDNGNKFLALGRSAEAGRTITLVNGLGCSVKQPFRFEADIRPPSQWSGASGAATISLGDSQMLQTEAPESVYGTHSLVTFGFSGTNDCHKVYSTTDGSLANTTPYYFAGCKAKFGSTEIDAEIDTTHWYRFRLEVNPETGTYDGKLFDMGSSHPTTETKGGTLVATATGLSFENPLATGEGVSPEGSLSPEYGLTDGMRTISCRVRTSRASSTAKRRLFSLSLSMVFSL